MNIEYKLVIIAIFISWFWQGIWVQALKKDNWIHKILSRSHSTMLCTWAEMRRQVHDCPWLLICLSLIRDWLDEHIDMGMESHILANTSIVCITCRFPYLGFSLNAWAFQKIELERWCSGEAWSMQPTIILGRLIHINPNPYQSNHQSLYGNPH